VRRQLYAGIDLHGNNLVIAIVDKQGRRIDDKRMICRLDQVLDYLQRQKGRIVRIAVESTFNWYWLVDGLQDAGYEVVLANPAGMNQYEGLKCANDKTDAYFIAELLRLGILETGHIYQREQRGMRDLLRRRHLLVGKRTALILSLKNQHARTHGRELKLADLKSMEPEELSGLFEDPFEALGAQIGKEQIESLTRAIRQIEKACWKEAQKMPGYARLRSLPGIGPVLSGVIMLEVGDITRFKSPENYASYCRAVAAKKQSNGKNKGENNRKCGNKYLGWAYIEAANLARRYDEDARRWYDRKAAKRGKIIATKALACKLAKATWHVLAEDTTYDPQRLFGTA